MQGPKSGLSLGNPVGVGAMAEAGELTCTNTSFFLWFLKPRAWNTCSRTVAVMADTPRLLSIRATCDPCILYFPWRGKARDGLSRGHNQAIRIRLGQMELPTTLFPRLS